MKGQGKGRELMRLNGWQRIGVVLSVLWVIVGGFWTRGIVIESQSEFARTRYRACLASHSIQPDGSVPADTDWSQCDRQHAIDWQRDVTDHWDGINGLNAAFTLGPLLIAWLLVYALVGLTRWIMAGFAS
jgi:hypothetical protein